MSSTNSDGKSSNCYHGKDYKDHLDQEIGWKIFFLHKTFIIFKKLKVLKSAIGK